MASGFTVKGRLYERCPGNFGVVTGKKWKKVCDKFLGVKRFLPKPGFRIRRDMVCS